MAAKGVSHGFREWFRLEEKTTATTKLNLHLQKGLENSTRIWPTETKMFFHLFKTKETGSERPSQSKAVLKSKSLSPTTTISARLVLTFGA